MTMFKIGQSAAKPYLYKERSTTIESIAKKKYLGEEASRVHLLISGNGRQFIFGNRI